MLLAAIGGEEGCRRLSANFYARVATDATLRPLFPGKSLRCATEEFAAFLIQFLDGDETQTQKRWWLSLRESHARFRVSAEQRAAWLRHMRATLEPLDAAVRESLWRVFSEAAGYVTGADDDGRVLGDQRRLDDAVAAISAGRDEEAISLAAAFSPRGSIFVGLLARLMQSQRPALIDFALRSVTADLLETRFAGRSLLHFAAAAGCLPMVELLLRLGMPADVLDHGGHTPLYAVANECGSPEGPPIVRALVAACADVNAHGGVTRATPLHMAARRGNVEIARELLESGAHAEARDRKGDTPLQRARNCRRPDAATLLMEWAKSPTRGV